MRQILRIKKEYKLAQVPSPLCGNDEVLVKVKYSALIGNVEKSVLTANKGNIAQKLMKQPELLNSAISTAKKEGLVKTYKLGRAIMSGWHTVGSSVVGDIIEVGENVKGFKIGDIVVCAGWKKANHAEYVAVDEKNVAKVPENYNQKQATLLPYATKLLDLIEDLKLEKGSSILIWGINPGSKILKELLEYKGHQVRNVEKGATPALEADYIFTVHEDIDSNEIEKIKPCIKVSTKFYFISEKRPTKELIKTFKIESFKLFTTKDLQEGEEKYVYNMKQKLVNEIIKNINLFSLIDSEMNLPESVSQYPNLIPKSVILIRYDPSAINNETVRITHKEKPSGTKCIAIIGAGSVAHSVHIPTLIGNKNTFIKYILTKSGWSAASVASHYDIPYVTNSFEKILNDPEVDIILILTHHSSHAKYAIEAIKAGKDVFVEKPIAITASDCKKIKKELDNRPVVFTTGYNKVFSPLSIEAKKLFQNRKNPLLVTYRMQSQVNKNKPWCYDPLVGGGRLIGEYSTIFYYVKWLVGQPIKEVQATSLNKDNNLSILLKFEDGSVANLICTEDGTNKGSKERIELICDNQFIAIDNWNEITINGKRRAARTNKGFSEHWTNFIKRSQSRNTGGNNIDDILEAMDFCFKASKSLPKA